MNPGSASRVLARASQREREDRTFHEQRLALEERLAELEDSGHAQEGEMVIRGPHASGPLRVTLVYLGVIYQTVLQQHRALSYRRWR